MRGSAGLMGQWQGYVVVAKGAAQCYAPKRIQTNVPNGVYGMWGCIVRVVACGINVNVHRMCQRHHAELARMACR